MKFRKSALLIAAVAFLFAWVTPVVSLADDDMDVGDLSAILTTTVNSFDVGDTVYVDITLDGNTGVSVLDLNLNYDTDKLTYDIWWVCRRDNGIRFEISNYLFDSLLKRLF